MKSAPARQWLLRRSAINLGVGCVIWLMSLALFFNSSSLLSQIDLLILLSITILTPLVTMVATQIDRNGKLSLMTRIVIYMQPVSAVLAGISLQLPVGGLAGALALAWFVQTFLLFFNGLSRWLSRPYSPIEEICIDAGFMYVLISGVWFVPYRVTGTFLFFAGPLVPLTVAHFIFISLGGLMIAGMIGRQLRSTSNIPSIYRFSAWTAIISPLLVAFGITHTAISGVVSIIEVISVVLLASSYLLLAGLYFVVVRPTITNGVARIILSISSATLFLTMTLALGYSIGRTTNWWVLTIPDMVRWHGWFNAVGFTGLGVVGWGLFPVVAHVSPAGIPFSRLPWHWRIGADFFENIGAVTIKAISPTGIADDLSQYAATDCQIENLEPHIPAFYENTSQHQLRVYPEWSPRFRTLSRLYKRFSRRVDQMNLPLEPESNETHIYSRIVPLNDVMDGRESVRGWIRTYANTGEAVYVAAYASHVYTERRYMNIAFPLPGGNLTSVLRLQTYLENDFTVLHLTSLANEHTPGDQGVYFVTSFLPLRLPVNETIDVYPVPYRDFPDVADIDGHTCAYARHRMWLFGIHFLTLHYTLWCSTD